MISRTLAFSAALLLFSGIFSFHASPARAQGNPAPAPTPAASHPQSDSLGDAARQARAQKPRPAKPAQVFTNEDVHGLKDSFSEKGHSKHANHASSPKPLPR